MHTVKNNVVVQNHLIGKADRNEINFYTSMHTMGAQNTKYIGMTCEGKDANRYRMSRHASETRLRRKTEVNGLAYDMIYENKGPSNIDNPPNVKFYTNEVVKAKQKMILGGKARLLKKLNTLRGLGQKHELTAKVDHWLKNGKDSPLYWKKPPNRARSYRIPFLLDGGVN